MKTPIKLLTPVVACVALLVSFALPAGAASSSYNVEAQRMRVTVSGSLTQNFDTPSGSTPSCPGSTSITGTIDDTAGTIDGTLNIVSSDFSVFSNNYQLTASGTASTGSYSGGTFSGLDFGTGSITFSIRPIDTSDCTTDPPVCTGTANLGTSGALISPAVPPLQTGDQIYVNGSGTIDSANCTLPWSFVIQKGSTLTIGANPAYASDPGAIFEQL